MTNLLEKDVLQSCVGFFANGTVARKDEQGQSGGASVSTGGQWQKTSMPWSANPAPQVSPTMPRERLGSICL